MEKEATQLPRITSDMLPKSIEQMTLAELKKHTYLLECILACLDEETPVLNADGLRLDVADVITKIEPTPTPFMESVSKKRRK